MRPASWITFSLGWALLIGLSTACGGQPPGEAETASASSNEAAAVGAAPGDASAAQLPPGHPPVGPGTPPGGVAPPAPGSGTGAAALTWTAPEGWIEETPSSAMRKAQYRVRGAGGEAECVVYYFGPGQGGSPMANALRWAGQFTQPDGRSPEDALSTEEIEVNGIRVLLSEVTGTYSGGMAMMGGPVETLENYMLLGAVAEGPDANWFFKLTGPEATVQTNRGAFEAMIRSLASGAVSTI